MKYKRLPHYDHGDNPNHLKDTNKQQYQVWWLPDWDPENHVRAAPTILNIEYVGPNMTIRKLKAYAIYY